MAQKHTFRLTASVLALIGLVTGQLSPSMAGQYPIQTAGLPQNAFKIVDVELGHDRALHGQLVDPAGRPRTGTEIAARAGGGEVIRTTTNEDGNFVIPRQGGGICVLTTERTNLVCRTWVNGSAPPTAIPAVLVTTDEETHRAALGNRKILLPILGASVALVLVTVLTHDSGSDNNGSEQPIPPAS